MSENELIVESDGLLSFSIRNESDRPWWWDLDLGGKPLYRISNLCGTCATMFNMINQAKLPLAPQELSALLAHGIQTISSDIQITVAALLPKGEYSVQLVSVTPATIIRGNENKLFNLSWGVDYYWQNHMIVAGNSVEYNVIFPIVAQSEINPDRVSHYVAKLKNKEQPVALCMTIEDDRSPSGRYQESVTAHILLDGHHKVMAASQLELPISLLSFNYHGYKSGYPNKSA